MAINPRTVNGDTFAKVVLERGLQVLGPLHDGYMYAGEKSDQEYILYRTSCVDWSRIKTITIAGTVNPAAGADPAAVTVPAGKRWLLLGMYFAMVTDANAANRYPYLTVRHDGTNATSYFGASTPQTASLTQNWGFAPGAGQGGAIGAGLVASVGFGEPIEIGPGGNFQIRFLNIQVGDDCTAVTYAYKEAPE